MIVILSIILILVAFLLLLVILIAIFFTIDAFLDLPYVATKKEKIETIIKLANIKKRETIVDLGSGDGRLLFAAAEKGARAIGYEINPFLIALTLVHAKLKGVAKRIVIYKQSLWKADLVVADVIFVYGRAKTMQRFEDFVFKNAQKGTRVIVNTNQFPNKRPIKSRNGIFLYNC